MNKYSSPSPARTTAAAKPVRTRKTRGVGIKTLITLSSITVTVGGWALISTDALKAQAPEATAQAVADAEALPVVPQVTFAPLPTIAPVATFEISPLVQPSDVNLQAQAQTADQVIPTPRPMFVGPEPTVTAQEVAPTARPRRIRTRATTRSSR